MSTTFNPTVGTRTSLAYNSTDLSTLASATFVRNTTAYLCNTNKPIDVVIEAGFTTTSSPSGNKQVIVFISESMDGANFRSGPTSGTTTTRLDNLRVMGVVPLTTASTQEIGFFSVMDALGYVPHSFYIIVYNDAGVALTSGTVFTAEISGVAT
jgi:hypothetical protein